MIKQAKNVKEDEAGSREQLSVAVSHQDTS